MKRLFLILIFALLTSPSFAFGEMDPAVVHKIVLAELAAMRLPANSPICLELLPARNMSEVGADPSPKLLRFLARKGMRARKASTCYNPPPRGNVISIESITETADRLQAKVALSDVTITADKDLGVLHRRGVYQLIRSRNGKWTIQSYTAE